MHGSLRLVVVWLVATVAAGEFIGCTRRPQSSTTPPPGAIAQDLSALVRMAELIVVGQVAKIKPGRSASQGEARMQFNDVEVRVEQALKGQTVADTIVEQVDTSRDVFSSEVGPPYRKGERYLLFLRKGEAGRYVTIPQGRYRLEDKRVEPVGTGPVAEKLKGTAESEAIVLVRSLIPQK